MLEKIILFGISFLLTLTSCISQKNLEYQVAREFYKKFSDCDGRQVSKTMETDNKRLQGLFYLVIEMKDAKLMLDNVVYQTDISHKEYFSRYMEDLLVCLNESGYNSSKSFKKEFIAHYINMNDITYEHQKNLEKEFIRQNGLKDNIDVYILSWGNRVNNIKIH